MNIAKSPRKPDIAGWCDKLEKANESVIAIQLSEDAHDARLAARVLKHAHFQGTFMREDGGIKFKIDGKVENPDCFACGESTVERGGQLLFCSDECKDIAAAVRYARKKIDEEIPWDFDLLVGFGQKIFPWASSGRTYDPQRRNVPQETRKAIFTRDEHRCVLCGEPATQIDHIAGSSSDATNLRAVCADCNRKLMLSNLVQITEEEKREAFKARANHLSSLISAPTPPSVGFDHKTWNDKWRTYAKMRQAFLPLINA